MSRRPFCGMAASFLFGILSAASLAEQSSIFLLVVAAMLVAVAVLLAAVMLPVAGIQVDWSVHKGREGRSRERQGRRQLVLRALLVSFMFVLGVHRYQQEEQFRAAYLPYLADGMQISVQGMLAQKQVKNHQYIYELSSCEIESFQTDKEKREQIPCNRILFYSDSDQYSIGDTLVLNGTITLWNSAVNEGGFDASSYYLMRKTDFKLEDVTVRAVYRASTGWKKWFFVLKERLFVLKEQLKEVYADAVRPKEGGILATMVLGDKELLDAEIKRLYQVGGVSHILAISGLHISVIGMSLYRFLRKRGLGFWTAGSFACSIMYVYGMMVGMGTSVRRALLMFFLLLLAEAAGRSYDTLNSLGIAAIALLWGNPYLLWDAGYQFSFAAIIGVAWVGRSAGRLKCHGAKLWEKLYAGAAIWLATLPLAAWYYYEIPMYAVAVNLLLLPVMGGLLALGLLGGFAGLGSLAAAKVMLFPCQLLLIAGEWLCSVCARLPGAMWVTGRPKVWQMAVYYVVLAAYTVLAYKKKQCVRQDSQTGRTGTAVKGAWSTKAGDKGDLQMGSFVLTVVVLLAILCVPVEKRFELDVLDVGQGDASFLRTQEGYTVFVDGGSSSVAKVGEYRVLPFLKYKGVGHVDCWIVSHTDEDHISGLMELLEMGYRVKRLILAYGVAEDEALEELLALAARQKTEILYLRAGDTLTLGEARLIALSPNIESGQTPEDKNEASLVVWYEEEAFSGIFTGDIGSVAEEELLPWLPGERVTFYKAAHHGSKYSNSSELLQRIRPQIAAVSCSAKNRYGHPAKEAVARMEETGSQVFFTMESGQIRLKRKGEELLVETYLQPEKVYVMHLRR